MQFPDPLRRAVFERREKRFLVYADLPEVGSVVAHTNNTGSMRGCLAPSAPVWLSPARNPDRKLRWTLELVQTVDGAFPGVAGGVLVGVNTALANRLVEEALTCGMVPELAGLEELRREVKYGSRGSRVDILLTSADGARTWVEVKNASLVEDGHARFPDSPTERGRKHLSELTDRVKDGEKAALIFCVQRGDATTVGPADDIDPEYGRLLREAAKAGVIVAAVEMDVRVEGIVPRGTLPVRL
ncbi:MAG: DNA/RNA nuclease SfsA [bacterium]|nr:DNA/RNA nuclease SfsA [bacterium]